MKFKLSKATFGQARVRGFTKKQFQRAVKISSSLKQFHSNKRILKEKLKATPKVEVQEKISQRIRKQLTYNSSYNISIRAIVINGEQTEQDLIQAIEEVLNSNPALQKIPFDTSGFEEEEIDFNEDRGLTKGEINIFLNIRGRETRL